MRKLAPASRNTPRRVGPNGSAAPRLPRWAPHTIGTITRKVRMKRAHDQPMSARPCRAQPHGHANDVVAIARIRKVREIPEHPVVREVDGAGDSPPSRRVTEQQSNRNDDTCQSEPGTPVEPRGSLPPDNQVEHFTQRPTSACITFGKVAADYVAFGRIEEPRYQLNERPADSRHHRRRLICSPMPRRDSRGERPDRRLRLPQFLLASDAPCASGARRAVASDRPSMS
jgi:hypothetical protein